MAIPNKPGYYQFLSASSGGPLKGWCIVLVTDPCGDGTLFASVPGLGTPLHGAVMTDEARWGSPVSCLPDRDLSSASTADARKSATDIKVAGDPDIWEIVCKASSKAQGWMKSTKRMAVDGGWLYQATTEHRSGADVTACAEALSFVPEKG